MSTAAELLVEARDRAVLSQAELARQAGIPRSVLNAYERGRREPGAEALARLLSAAGFRLVLAPLRTDRDGFQVARLLDLLCSLGEALPRRRRGVLAFPPEYRTNDHAQRLVALHEAFRLANIPHAFGGVIALAYYADDARITFDLSLHVFEAAGRAERVLSVLPDGVDIGRRTPGGCEGHDRIRVWWDDTPVDLIFGADEFDLVVASRIRSVPFLDQFIPVLDCSSLIVFNALRNDHEGWYGIESTIGTRTFDRTFAMNWLERLRGPDDEVTKRMAELLS